MSITKALLLVGSPKGERSTSNAIGSYLMKKLGDRGVETEALYVSRMVKSPEGLARMEAALAGADLLILAAPLYIDSIPAPVIRAMERIRDRCRVAPREKKQALFAIVNSGFPEPCQNRVALDIYRLFARDAGLGWAGGIGIGMGGAIDGKPLEDAGGMAKGLRDGLDRAASSLVAGEPVPESVLDRASRPFMPLPLVRLMLAILGKRIWAGQIKDKAILARIRDRPYESSRS